jgi:putative transposase
MIINDLRHKYSVRLLCNIAEVSRSGYYKYIKNQSEKIEKERQLKDILLFEYKRLKGIYGYRRIKILLKKKYFIKINHKKVLRLLNEMGLKSRIRRKHGFKFIGKGINIYPNILNRNFKSDLPNNKWVTDISHLLFKGQKMYISVFKDLFNNEIVGYKVSKNIDMELVMGSLKESLKNKKIGNLMIHSDQGFHYTTGIYSSYLKEQGIIQSMSNKGNCYDNASMENFFGHLKSEMLYNTNINTKDELKKEIENYISFYNGERIQEKLNEMCPIDYRNYHQLY